jgi:hypothetical protein
MGFGRLNSRRQRAAHGKYGALLFACLFLSGCQAYIQKALLPNDGMRPATSDVIVVRDVAFTTPGGIRLVADFYRPKDIEFAPTILVRIPFSNTLGNRLRADAVAHFWAGRGYNVVIQGTRGRYKSDGRHYPLRHEREDGLATLRWLAAQPWFDGRLGMWGGSAFGYTQWALADQDAPGPSALMIQIASTDFHGMFYPGGAFSLESALFWAARSHGDVDTEPSFKKLEKGFQDFPLIEADDRAFADVGFFNDWAMHTQRDAYWNAIDGENRARTLKAPVLLMAGWFDPFLPTQIRDFQRIRREAGMTASTKSRLVIGPWSHADTVSLPGAPPLDNYRKAALAPSIAWFDEHLMGKPGADQAPVRIFVMGDNVWRDELTWPPERAQTIPFYLAETAEPMLQDAGKLTNALPASDAILSYVYDPQNPVPTRGGAMLGPRAGIAIQNDIERRPDVAVFLTEPLEHDIEVTGNVSAILYVSTTAPNTDFTAKLVDRHADGTTYNVCDGIQRRRYDADGSEQATEITIDLWPTSMVFRKGHRIGLEISSSNFPRYDRNPNTGGDIPLETLPVSARQSILFGTQYPSRLLLSVVPR